MWRPRENHFYLSYGTYAYRRMPFGLCNAPVTFQRRMYAIFHGLNCGSIHGRFFLSVELLWTIASIIFFFDKDTVGGSPYGVDIIIIEKTSYFPYKSYSSYSSNTPLNSCSVSIGNWTRVRFVFSAARIILKHGIIYSLIVFFPKHAGTQLVFMGQFYLNLSKVNSC